MAQSFDPAARSLFTLAQIQHLMRVEFNRAQRYQYAIAFMLLAVDRLGSLRDLYGYDAKEEILDGIVGMMKGETRASDFLGRLADDRLILVLPHTDGEGCSTLASRMLDKTNMLDFESDGRSIRVSLSIGVAFESEGEGLFFDGMLDSAETALGDAIAAGGSRFILADAGRH